MQGLSMNENAALTFVLEYLSLKDILISAMHYLAAQDDIHSQDSANVCCKAVKAFLK